MKKILLYSMLLIIFVVLIFVIRYAWVSFPIITGFDAKQVCSCMFVSERDQKDIDSSEMSSIPFSLAKYKVDMHDSSVTATILGMARKKAIFRKGIGCTLINDISEKELRSQVFEIPPPTLLNIDSVAWPYGDKINDTLSPVINKTKLEATINDAFTEPYPGKKQRTRAVVVVYDGELIAEKYAPGFTKDTKMYGWSMAKSFTSALIGILVKQQKLDLQKPAPVPEWQNEKDARHFITIEQLLQQTSGIDFEEKYTKASDVTNMLYKKADMAAYAANHSLAHDPGTVFNYSSGNSNILSRIIRQTVSEKDYAAFAAKELFYKANMYHTSMEPDASGTYVGSSYINATARDYARFGLLYYNDGIWNGERILPEGWVKKTSIAPSANKLQNYGYQFWLNGNKAGNPPHHVFPDVPEDLIYADGFAYQNIYIIPSKKLVVVRLGLTLDNSFNENNFLKNIIKAIDGKN